MHKQLKVTQNLNSPLFSHTRPQILSLLLFQIFSSLFSTSPSFWQPFVTMTRASFSLSIFPQVPFCILLQLSRRGFPIPSMTPTISECQSISPSNCTISCEQNLPSSFSSCLDFVGFCSPLRVHMCQDIPDHSVRRLVALAKTGY